MVLSARNGQSMRVTQVGGERPHRHLLPQRSRRLPLVAAATGRRGQPAPSAAEQHVAERRAAPAPPQHLHLRGKPAFLLLLSFPPRVLTFTCPLVLLLTQAEDGVLNREQLSACMQRIIAVPNTTEEEKLIWVRVSAPPSVHPFMPASHVFSCSLAALPH